MTRKELYVFAQLPDGFTPAGLLTLTETSREVQASTFAYGSRYIEKANAFEIDPVSLSLTDQSRVRNRVFFPANGLPLFGGVRDAAPDAWGRRVIEARHHVPANSLPESTYLLEAGSDRVGALDVRSDRDDAPSAGVANIQSLQYLLEAAERIERGEDVPARLADVFGSAPGAGGARPKASVRDSSNLLWLAKFASRSDTFDVAQAEMATLQLAGACGMTVPDTKVVDIGGKNCLLIRRFDRYWLPRKPMEQGLQLIPADLALHETLPDELHSQELRLPFVSALTMLGCDEFASRTKGYADIAAAVRQRVHVDAIRADNHELFARMLFNILVSNDDDHLRNHGFVRDPRMGGWRLSPLYDVVPRPGIAYERFLHLEVGEKGKLATLDNALSFHTKFGLERPQAVALIAHLVKIVSGWRDFFEQRGLDGKLLDRLNGAFRQLDELCSPALRMELARSCKR